MIYYEYAVSEGFGTLTNHEVGMFENDPIAVFGDIEFKEITQAEYEAFGPNRVPQYGGEPSQCLKAMAAK